MLDFATMACGLFIGARKSVKTAARENKMKTKYLILMLAVGCGAPDKKNVEAPKKEAPQPDKTPSKPAEPSIIQRPKPRIVGGKYDFKLPTPQKYGERQIPMVPWDPNLPLTQTCFTWDPMANVTFKVFISSISNVFTGAFIGSVTVNEACVENLVRGEQYYIAISAMNSVGESPLSVQLPFRPAYIISKTDMKLVQGYDMQGRQSIRFKGPPGIMEANFGFVQWSPDLVNWQALQVAWEYNSDGIYSFLMPNMGERAFFRLGFTLGIE